MVLIDKLLATVRIAAMAIVVVSIVMYFAGFKFSLKVSNADQKADRIKLDSAYRARLASLKVELNRIVQENIQLEAKANHFLSIATPAIVRAGPDYIDLDSKHCISHKSTDLSPVDLEKPLEPTFEDVIQESNKLNEELDCQIKKLDSTLTWLNSLPTGMPILGGRLTRGFGVNINPDTGKASRHDGVDFQVDRGVPVITAGDGIIKKISKEKTYGNVIEIIHAEGFITSYARIRKISVYEGQKVKRGEQIAVVGGSGSPNEHLHYGIYIHDKFLDPLQFMPLSKD